MGDGSAPRGTAFGVIFDSTWKSELHTDNDKIEFKTEGAPFRAYVIDRATPQEVLKGLAELTGTMEMPARWTLGYQQCRFSYGTEQKVREIADNFRARRIPCDVIWMDIDYMGRLPYLHIQPTELPRPQGPQRRTPPEGIPRRLHDRPGSESRRELPRLQIRH